MSDKAIRWNINDFEISEIIYFHIFGVYILTYITEKCRSKRSPRRIPNEHNAQRTKYGTTTTTTAAAATTTTRNYRSKRIPKRTLCELYYFKFITRQILHNQKHSSEGRKSKQNIATSDKFQNALCTNITTSNS